MSVVHVGAVKKLRFCGGRELHPTEKLVLLILADYAHPDTGVAWPAHQSLADDCCISLSTAKRTIATLAELRVIEVIPRKDPRGVSLTNHYRMLVGGTPTGGGVGVHPRTGEEFTGEPGVGSPVDRGGVTDEPGVGSPVNPELPIELPVNNQENKNTKAAALVRDAEEIYKAFPRKEGKPKALDAIKKALTHVAKQGEADPKRFLLDRVNAYDQQLKIRGTEFNKIKMPQGWFNDQRYNDESLKPAPRTEYIEIDPAEAHRKWMNESGMGHLCRT